MKTSYTPAFNLGQKVFAISSNNTMTKTATCPTCNGSSKVMIGNEEFHCPKCQGGQRQKYYTRWYISEKDATIGQIQIKATDAPYLWSNPDTPIEVQYMLRETGVGSGTLWSEDVLFATENEAQEACSRRNAALENGELK